MQYPGHGARAGVTVLTPENPQRLAFPTWVTSSSSFPARNLKADVLETGQPQGGGTGNGPQGSATSALFQPQGGSLVLITPLLQGADNGTMNVELWHWDGTPDAPGFPNMTQWTPYFLGEVLCTACTKVGLGTGTGPIPAAARYCDTLAYPTNQATDDGGLPPLNIRFVGPTTVGNTAARIAIDYLGSPLIEVRLKVTSAGDQANALIKTV